MSYQVNSLVTDRIKFLVNSAVEQIHHLKITLNSSLLLQSS
jgi:hypothetical protein